MRKMLLSFKPEVYEKIKSGKKKFEHRRNFPDEPIMAYMYVNAPIKAIKGIVYLGKRHLFGDAIHAVFPQAEIQRCIVHQIRYSTKFISYKDLKPFMADLKLVYKADTEDLALTALEDLEEKWGKKYPASIGSWRNN